MLKERISYSIAKEIVVSSFLAYAQTKFNDKNKSFEVALAYGKLNIEFFDLYEELKYGSYSKELLDWYFVHLEQDKKNEKDIKEKFYSGIIGDKVINISEEAKIFIDSYKI